MRHFVKIFAIILFSIVLGVVGYEIYNIVFTDNINLALHISFLAVGVVVGLGLILFLAIKTKRDKCSCNKCGSSLKGCAYEWQLVRIYDTLENQMAQYQVTATCPKCGKEKIFNKDFIVASERTGAVANPQKLIEDWCKQMFGH